MSENGLFSYRPRKIIITITPSIIFNHPLSVINHKLSVLRFQRSLCDVYSTSNGFLRDLNTNTVTPFPASYGLMFLKDLTASIYKSEGIFGFFRCLPQYIAYHLTKDLLRYLVPNFVFPVFSKIESKFPEKISLYNILNTHYTTIFRQKWSLSMERPGLIDAFVDFYKKQIQYDKHKILTSFITEVLTYPALVIISRMIIYDGYGPVSFYPLLKHTITVDGLPSLYRGFVFYLATNFLKYISQHFNKFIDRCLEYNIFLGSRLEQSIVVILSMSQTVLTQFSLIRRCGSNIDGFCINESSVGIFRQMPWMSILTQILITIVLVHLKEKLLSRQMDELNIRLRT